MDIVTKRGAHKQAWVYMVGGHQPKPLLQDRDAEDVGIISNKEGRDPTYEEKKLLKKSELIKRLREEGEDREERKKRKREGSNPRKLRDTGTKVETGQKKLINITKEDKNKALDIVNKFKSPVFKPCIGLIQTKPVKL